MVRLHSKRWHDVQELLDAGIDVFTTLNVQHIAGKPAGTGWLESLHGDRLLRRLARESGDIDLQVVRAEKSGSGATGGVWLPVLASGFHQYLFAVAVVVITGIVNLGLMALSGRRVPGLVFLLAVVLVALKVGRGPVLLAGAMSAPAWNFFCLHLSVVDRGPGIPTEWLPRIFDKFFRALNAPQREAAALG